MTATEIYDLLIIGGGLSGSRLVIRLLDALLSRARSGSAARRKIAVVDRFGAFGGGVPYGRPTTQPGFLLIESVEASTPPAFHRWLRANRSILTGASQSADPSLVAWAAANAAKIAEGRYGELFVPRRLFGEFIEEELRAKMKLAAVRGVADVTLVRAEALDVEPGPPFRVFVAPEGRPSRAEYISRSVVLAVGCIPKKNDFGLTLDDGYVHAPYADAFDGMADTLRRRAASAGRAVNVVILGSGASASEVIYHLRHTPDLLAGVASIEVVSSSGYLAGGAVEAVPSYGAASSLARGRPSSSDYVEAAARLAEAGKLRPTSAKIVRVDRGDRSLLAVHTEGQPNARTITADVVINCTGVGRIDQTDSDLLRSLAAPGRPFKPNESGRGFELRPESYEVNGLEGCFVIGPLLNQDALETHVEGIPAVYRVADALAEHVYDRWKKLDAPHTHRSARGERARPSEQLRQQLGFSASDRVVVLHADDIGMCGATVSAYGELVARGILSSASVMAPSGWLPAVARVCRDTNLATDMGVHLTLTSEWADYRWGPLTSASELRDEDGYFPATAAEAHRAMSPEGVYRELHAQVERARALGIDVTHLDSHMLALFSPTLFGVFLRLSRELRIPCCVLPLNADERRRCLHMPVAASDALYEQIRAEEQGGLFVFDAWAELPLDTPGRRLDTAKRILDGLPAGFSYFISHPAVETPELRAILPDWEARVADYRLYLEDDWQRAIEDSGVRVVGMRAIRDALFAEEDVAPANESIHQPRKAVPCEPARQTLS